jgi:large subunit ribosomal protein L27
MSHKKAGGSTRLGRDSQPQYLGVKVGDGQTVKPGMVLVRQRGTRINPGKNVKKGVDDTLFSIANGVVKFTQKKKMHFDGSLRPAKFVSVCAKSAK